MDLRNVHRSNSVRVRLLLVPFATTRAVQILALVSSLKTNALGGTYTFTTRTPKPTRRLLREVTTPASAAVLELRPFWGASGRVWGVQGTLYRSFSWSFCVV